MYCKHCGKQIAEDSKFCQYCGGVQDEQMVSPIRQETKSGEQEKVIKIPSIRTNLSDKTKKWLAIYFGWLMLNLFFLVCKGTYIPVQGRHAYDCLFPFQYYDWRGYLCSGFEWNLVYYDFSDFLFYGFFIPAVTYLIVKFWERKKKWLSIYIAWLMLNILFLVLGHETDECLFPFKYDYNLGYYGNYHRVIKSGFKWDLWYYDFSEFVLYGFFIPAVTYLIVKFWKKIMKK